VHNTRRLRTAKSSSGREISFTLLRGQGFQDQISLMGDFCFRRSPKIRRWFPFEDWNCWPSNWRLDDRSHLAVRVAVYRTPEVVVSLGRLCHHLRRRALSGTLTVPCSGMLHRETLGGWRFPRGPPRRAEGSWDPRREGLGMGAFIQLAVASVPKPSRLQQVFERL